MLYTILSILAGVVLLALLFLWWLVGSVVRGARKRDELLLVTLEPLAERIAGGEEIPPTEIADVAARPEMRPLLYELLKHYERLDLFPEAYIDPSVQGEALLAYWMLHPNELKGTPETTELLARCDRQVEGVESTFFVYRYRMPEGHWAGADWILGLAGPFVATDVPFSGVASAFSRCTDKEGSISPDDLVDRFIEMITRKGSAAPGREP
jgi:hypothetical protein